MRYAIVLLISCFTTPLLAQQPIFKNYTVNDGLVANSIRRIFQDSKGFLWIATWEGLSKYDGHKFTNYSTSNGLSHDLVNDFHEGADGRLYITLNNGDIDIIKETTLIRDTISPTVVVNRFVHMGGHPVLATTDLHGVQEFTDGNLRQPKQAFPNYNFFDLKWINDSLFMAIGDSYVGAFNEKYELIRELRFPSIEFVGSNSKIFRDSKKRIWLGTNYGLELIGDLTQGTDPIPLLPLPTAFNIPALQRAVYDIFEDADGSLWFATTGGLVVVKPDGSHQLITVKDGLISNIVNLIFQDKEKNIWFGTEVGLSKLVTKSSIRLYAMENGVWKNDGQYLLYPFKKEHFLVGTRSGSMVFNKLTGSFTPVSESKDELYYNVVANTDPELFVGINKLVRFNKTSLRFEKSHPLPAQQVVRIISDKKGNIFFSNMKEFLFDAGKTDQIIFEYRVTGVLIDNNGDLWAATWQNGLFRIRYDVKNNRMQVKSKDHFFPDEKIRSLFKDSKGNIWVGTRYRGVYRFINNGNDSFAISNFDRGEGLSSSFVKVIREDNLGNIWIGFYQGLDKLIPSGDSFHVFNFSRINNYYTSIIGMETDGDHSLWLATGEGLTHVIDGEMEKLPAFPVYITRISSPTSIYPLNEDNLQLTHRHNQLQFEFSSPAFINEKQVLYSYRLSGSSNPEWTEASNQHIVSYASLQPGNYLFEVRSKGWDGSWGKITSFGFSISPPFWQSWWFILIGVFFCATVVFGIIKRRIKAIRHESEMKQKIAGTEMMALRAQMNPHFIFNCLNSIDNLIQTDQKEKATDYLAKFAQLIRAILENSKNNMIPCWKDLETLELYLEMEKLRWDNKITYALTIDAEIQQGDYKVPPMIVQPYIENAIHHGLLNKMDADKKLDIEVHLEENNIKYTITDNGVGRQKAAEYKKINKPSQIPFGLQITKDRIDLFNQHKNGSVKITDLYNPQHLPEGTKVEVWLTTQPITT